MLLVISVGTYKDNAVTITHSLNASVAGSDEKSSTVDVTSANFKMYNINVVNSFGKGSQVKNTLSLKAFGFLG
jgi:pectinesterase